MAFVSEETRDIRTSHPPLDVEFNHLLHPIRFSPINLTDKQSINSPSLQTHQPKPPATMSATESTPSTPSTHQSADGGRRRSSGQMFGNLSAYKRDGTAYETRRMSVSDQVAKQGFLATAYNKYVPWFLPCQKTVLIRLIASSRDHHLLPSKPRCSER